MRFIPVRVKDNLLPIFLLLLIVTIFLCSRLYKLDQVPSALYWDEASIGYNAYSVLKTGTDEWGKFLPIHFKAFGEYKLPVYIYTVSFFESILGLNTIAIRLPAVLFSLGSLLMVFLLVKRFFSDVKLALIASFIFATTPWLFVFSRSGYEATAGLFFILLGIYFFFMYEKNPLFFISSAASFLLSIYSYNSFRILLPFIGLWFLIYLLYKKKLVIKRNIIFMLAALAIFVIGSIPIVNLYMSSDGLERFNDVGIYKPGDSRKLALMTFANNYVAHFNPSFLFLSGDQNLRSHTGGVGEFYWLSLPFILIGLIVCLKYHKSSHLFILFLLLIAPIPAAITKETPHALRALFMVVPLSILTAIGIQIFCKKVHFRNHLLLAILFLFTFLFTLYLAKFFSTYATESAQSWQSEYKQVYDIYGDSFSHYDYVVVSDRYAQ